MRIEELPKHYDPKLTEDKWYDFWLNGRFFHAQPENGKTPYSIVIPPPNVTDILHLGHALNNTLQDILARWKRLQQYEVEWLPGIDHAGIATQVVIEKNLAKEGKTKESIGREKFVKLAWEWKEKNGKTILNQLKKIGCSCDWDRTRFTLDEGLSQAVLEVFVHLYKKGLIYRGKYIINWCPRCQTSLSDDEVEREEKESNLWYIKYKLKGSDKYISVATTRPDTMLGDTAVAVNPDDKRYKKLVGKSAILPILDRELPIIADDYVDPKFGTGAVKVTPAHDPNDFEMGVRHNLDRISVMNPDGTMNQDAGKFAGMDRYECRKALLAELKKKKLLEKTEPYTVPIANCYRCNTNIEPYLSEQWFVRMKPLAGPAIEAVKSGKIRFHPEHWTKVYMHWMENIRDWCISRQLWWGHRIPVWYCLDCGELIVDKTPPKKCTKCNSTNLKQDADVLDTWFSSWLWPFSTFGWPDKTKELQSFYPTKALFTASEIIFLWVARMIMAGLEFMGDIPFSDVYIHGTVRDARGIKMSKSLGNGIDPLDIIKEYGTDALRVSMILVTPEGQDPYISFNTFQIGRNFANKLWNASKFVMANLKSLDLNKADLKIEDDHLELADRWILSCLNKTVQDVTQLMGDYRFNSSVKVLYDFVWHDFCDWWVELVKPRFGLPDDNQEKIQAQKLALLLLDNILKLLHPFMPFITEEIWHRLYNLEPEDSDQTLMLSKWPYSNPDYIDSALEERMQSVQDVVSAIRNIRSEINIPPAKKAQVLLKIDKKDLIRTVDDNKHYILNLGRVDELKIGQRIKRPPKVASAVIKDMEVFVILEGLIDPEVERKRLQKEIQRITTLLDKTTKKLSNDYFLKKAPKNIIEKERAKKEDYQKMLDKLNKNLEMVLGW
ncbi:MAG: valine--tRNA ligase [Candidatus Zixiibacteriota bacterium]